MDNETLEIRRNPTPEDIAFMTETGILIPEGTKKLLDEPIYPQIEYRVKINPGANLTESYENDPERTVINAMQYAGVDFDPDILYCAEIEDYNVRPSENEKELITTVTLAVYGINDLEVLKNIINNEDDNNRNAADLFSETNILDDFSDYIDDEKGYYGIKIIREK